MGWVAASLAAVALFGLLELIGTATGFALPWGSTSKARSIDLTALVVGASGGTWIGAQIERRLADRHFQPWYADRIVDLEEAERRAFVEGGIMPDEFLVVPSPYFVLGLEGPVKWGFATPMEIRTAAEMAKAPNVPEAWCNPLLLGRLGFMGWHGVEARARVGLFLRAAESRRQHEPLR